MPLALDMRFTPHAWTTLAFVDHLGWHLSVPHRRVMPALYAIRPLDRKLSNPGSNSFTSPKVAPTGISCRRRRRPPTDIRATKATTLLVDDAPDLLEVLALHLRRAGFGPLPAVSL